MANLASEPTWAGTLVLMGGLLYAYVVVLMSFVLSCGGERGARTPSEGAHARWSYSGALGPPHWGSLEPSFATCDVGKAQSPIALPAHAPPSGSTAEIEWRKLPPLTRNDGHEVLVPAPPGSAIVLDGIRYELRQIHLHAPSEHTLAGRTYDAELHLVHETPGKDLLVASVLFTTGAESVPLRALFDAMAKHASAETSDATPLDIAALLPDAPRFLRYDGSLTTPPCTEGVTWLVLEPGPQGPATLSTEQLAALRGAIHAPNARPVQPLGGRTILEVAPHGPGDAGSLAEERPHRDGQAPP